MTQQEARKFWIALMQYRDNVVDYANTDYSDDDLEQICDRQLATVKVLFKDATGVSVNDLFQPYLLGDPVSAALPKMRTTMYNFD